MKHLRKFNESYESFEQSDIDHYLAYLYDEGFEFKHIGENGGFANVNPSKVIFMEKSLSEDELESILQSGLDRKSVIIGVNGAPLKVYTTQDKPKVDTFLSNFNSDIMNQIEFYAQDAISKILLDYPDTFNSKIIISFKTPWLWLDREIRTIRLQLIFTKK